MAETPFQEKTNTDDVSKVKRGEYMKLKKEYFILAAILAVLILYLALHRTNRTNYQLPELTAVPEKQISKIEITTAGKSIVLNKKDDAWSIEPKGYPADPEKVKSMLNVIGKLKLTALVSESKNYVRYDLGSDKTIRVKAWKGSTLARDFDIGKTAPTYKHTFVKLANDPDVYHAREDFRRKFDQSVSDLRNKTVMSYAQNTIEKITLSHDKKTASFVRKEIPETTSGKKEKAAKAAKAPKTKTVWEDAKGGSAAPSKISRLLSFLNHLECEKYIEGAKKEDFKNPVYTVSLKGEKDYSLSIFEKKDKKDENYAAVSSGNDYPFFLSSSQVDGIKSKVDDLLKVKEK
jgi:Domain of unknown function (DUF4340)